MIKIERQEDGTFTISGLTAEHLNAIDSVAKSALHSTHETFFRDDALVHDIVVEINDLPSKYFR